MTARDVFEQARDAALALMEHERRLEYMRDRIGVQGRALEASFSQGLDPMRKVDDLLDWEIEEEGALASSYAAIAEAEDVIRGIRSLGGKDMADTLSLVYIEALDLHTASLRLGQNVDLVRLMCLEAFEWIDSYGLAKLKEAGR